MTTENAQTPEYYQDLLKTPYPPSQHQCAIFDWVRTGRGNAVVEAVAGSGKSTTVEWTCRLLTTPTLVVAFNKSVERDMSRRLVGTKALCKTVHGTGLGAIRSNVAGRTDVKKWKYHDILDQWSADLRSGRPTIFGELTPAEEKALTIWGQLTLPSAVITRIFGLARLDLMDFDCEEYPTCLWDLVHHHNLDAPEGLDRIITLAVAKLAELGRENPNVVDFTDMVWLPVVNGYRPKTYNWVFVDECQDISAAHLALLRKCVKRGGRMLFVGDRRQCQPGDTQIRMSDGSLRRMEDIQTGDEIVSYDRRSSMIIKKARVNAVASRPYKGTLVEVAANTLVSRSTPDHRWLVRWVGHRTDLWCVYLMRSGSSFRVGMCQMFTKARKGSPNGDFHLGQRARLENADAVWVLDVFEDQIEARISEMQISVQFGIPQTVFLANQGAYILDQDALDLFWVRMGDLRGNAQKCLLKFGRLIDHPLYDRTQRQRQGRTTLFETVAANLIEDYMAVPIVPDAYSYDERTARWSPITVQRVEYEGDVYSLDVDVHHKYVSDGLVTCNCIYRFAGADHQSFEKIIEQAEATLLPLSVCYRCPTKVLDLAREHCPQIEARPDAPEGIVHHIDYGHLVGSTREGDMILCRRNAPLLSVCFALIADGIAAQIKGRDIGVGLQKAIDKIARLGTWEDFSQSIDLWLEKEQKLVLRRGGRPGAVQTRLQGLDDKAECIRIIYARSTASNAKGLKDDVAALFSDERPSVQLSSIHRAKGMENGRVFILGSTRLSFPGMQPWQLEQERNLTYVAYTRAQEELLFVALPE